MNTERICPNCRKPLPPDGPPGLCPECLAKSGIPPISPLPGWSPAAAPDAMIAAPAVGLMVVGALKLFKALKILLVFGLGANWLNSVVPGFGALGRWDAFILLAGAYKMIAGFLILFGGYQMHRRQSYAWAVAAGVISIVACSLLGLPVGIWALVVLGRQDVRAVFDNPGVAASPGGSRPPSWPVPLVVIACFVLAFAMVTSLGFAAVRAVESIGDQFAAHPDTISSMPPLDLQTAGINRDGREFRKESTQSFPLDANGQFSIDDVNGRVEIQGWNSNIVVLNAVIHGKTAVSVAAVKINVDSDPSRVSVHTKLPSRANDSSLWDWFKNDIGNASVDYIVHVPLHARLENVSTVNGTLGIDGMTDDISASTVNGTARVKNAAGNLTLSTVNGAVTADMDRLGQGQSVSLNTVNGQIKLAFPDTADASFSIATINGNISSDFSDLAVKRQFPIGSSLNGSLGNGAGTVKANTVNGTIEIRKVEILKVH